MVDMVLNTCLKYKMPMCSYYPSVQPRGSNYELFGSPEPKAPGKLIV